MQNSDIARYDLNLLRALRALLELAHVSDAADRCSMSQPAMSRTLARLRRDFGDPLLVRAGGGLRRTPRAEALVEPLHAALAQLTRLYREDGFDPQTAQRVFRAAIPDALAASLLAPLVSALAQEAPGCGITVVPWPGADRLALDTLDFAISTELDLFTGFRATALFDDHDVLAVGAARRATYDTGDVTMMLSAAHVAIQSVGRARDPVDDWLASIGLGRTIRAIVPHYLQALLLVSRSDFVSILPSRLVASYGPALDVIGIEIPVSQAVDQFYLFHPVEQHADPASRWMLDLISRTVEKAVVP